MVDTTLANNVQIVSDTYGSNFNQASRGALEQLAKHKAPNGTGWGCKKNIDRFQSLLNSPSKGAIDEHHFATDLRKAKRAAPKHVLREIDGQATGMATW